MDGYHERQPQGANQSGVRRTLPGESVCNFVDNDEQLIRTIRLRLICHALPLETVLRSTKKKRFSGVPDIRMVKVMRGRDKIRCLHPELSMASSNHFSWCVWPCDG